jgi:hypothetical protein
MNPARPLAAHTGDLDLVLEARARARPTRTLRPEFRICSQSSLPGTQPQRYIPLVRTESPLPGARAPANGRPHTSSSPICSYTPPSHLPIYIPCSALYNYLSIAISSMRKISLTHSLAKLIALLLTNTGCNTCSSKVLDAPSLLTDTPAFFSPIS